MNMTFAQVKNGTYLREVQISERLHSARLIFFDSLKQAQFKHSMYF